MIFKYFLPFGQHPFHLVDSFLCSTKWNVFFIYLSISLGYRVTSMKAETTLECHSGRVFMKYAHLQNIKKYNSFTQRWKK